MFKRMNFGSKNHQPVPDPSSLSIQQCHDPRRISQASINSNISFNESKSQDERAYSHYNGHESLVDPTTIGLSPSKSHPSLDSHRPKSSSATLPPLMIPETPVPTRREGQPLLTPGLSDTTSPSLKNRSSYSSASSFQEQKHVPTISEDESWVQQGIQFHETGQLEKATNLFRQAAQKENPIGMFLYAVSLRHGWGAQRDEFLAFTYLQKAAEIAIQDLATLSDAASKSASKNELVMAIYELGVSFRHGWGCKKNKERAVQFFTIAADLGDADAQNDLAHCYYHGHGLKKDHYKAAYYYRKAEKQGQGIMGNSWIHKSKYDKPKPKH
ncbi:hypothetical protein J3Q64DRAFT_1026436 [Phycomyces blakesleeanus]|uniref:HCP-like protein n=1 Tax=Phycomyces blakesleeanus TaxID=4837 RepID=A0ABR3BEJ4_PHYBL